MKSTNESVNVLHIYTKAAGLNPNEWSQSRNEISQNPTRKTWKKPERHQTKHGHLARTLARKKLKTISSVHQTDEFRQHKNPNNPKDPFHSAESPRISEKNLNQHRRYQSTKRISKLIARKSTKISYNPLKKSTRSGESSRDPKCVLN